MFFYFLANQFPHHRFAISVNRKIGNAVQRNYIKRVLKEWFRLNQHLVKGKMNNNFDIWIVVKSRVDRTNVHEAEQLFIDCLKKISRR